MGTTMKTNDSHDNAAAVRPIFYTVTEAASLLRINRATLDRRALHTALRRRRARATRTDSDGGEQR